MSQQIYFHHNIDNPNGGFTVVFHFDACDWFEGEGQVPELNYIDLNYDERQTQLIKACIESINSYDDTMVCAMQDAAEEFKKNQDVDSIWHDYFVRY
jgi:hypothetical protein